MHLPKRYKFLLLLLAALGAGYWAGKGGAAPADAPAAAAKEENSSAPTKKILYWQAPMDPTYIRDKPGKSPMGMDLIPVYEGADSKSDPDAITIDPVTVQNIGVKTATAVVRELNRTIRTVGSVVYNEKTVAHIHTKMEGWIEKLYVDFLGEEVKKGQPLLSIYSPELVSTQEEYLLALKYQDSLSKSPFSPISKGSNQLLSSTRRRLELWDITDDQIRVIEKKGKVQKTLSLHSPNRGVVIEKNVQEGMYIKPGRNLYTIADISTVWVHADIYEYELPWLSLGQKAEMTLSYLPGKVFKGRVIYIYPFLENRTRTVKIRLEFNNPDWELKPNMYANVLIRSKISEAALVVPEEAVIRSGERDVVVVKKGEGKFYPTDVRLGVQGEGVYQILSGIKEGDEIVTSAQFLIDSESRLKEAINKMLEAKKKPNPEAPPKDDIKSETPGNSRHSGSAVMVSPESKEKMERIISAAVAAHDALVKDSLEGMAELAEQIQRAALEIKPEERQALLGEFAADMDKTVGSLASNDIEKAREAYKVLSASLARYAKAVGRTDLKDKGIGIFYCPMLKTEWLQKGKQAGNPFYGTKMPSCGSAVDY